MKNVFSVLIMVVIVAYNSVGQTQEATTTSGEKVVLFSNGTWKSKELPKDTLGELDSDCNRWIETTTDKMEGTSYTSGKNTIIVSDDNGKTGFGIFMMVSTSGGLIVTIQAVGAGSCIEDNAKIIILFTDGSRIALINNGKFNCEGKCTLYFGDVFGKTDELNSLKTKDIQTMRVWTSKSFVEKDFTSSNQKEFKGTLNCLANLIK